MYSYQWLQKERDFFSSTNKGTGYTPHGVVRFEDFDSKDFIYLFFSFSSAASAIAVDRTMRKRTQALKSGRILRLLQNRASHLR